MSTQRRRKFQLTDVVAAALMETEEHGLERVTMRSVAERLGASPMMLYRHVANRDELADLVADEALANLELPPAAADDAIREWLTGTLDVARQRMLRYPGTADHLLLIGPSGPHTLAFMAAVCAVIRRTGRDAVQTAWAYDWLMTTASVYVSKETRLGTGRGRGEVYAAFNERAQTYIERHPDLADVVAAFAPGEHDAFQRATGSVIDALFE